MSVKAILAEQQKSYTKAEEEALLATKQNTLTFDTTPTAGSTNPVTSGGITTALDGRLPQPENAGAIGQVLTKTATGSVWQTQSSGGDIVAAASNSYAVTLYAASWSSQQQTIATPTGAEITSTSDGVLGLAAGATAAQVEAFQLAKIIVISQSSSGVVVKALGIVPTINLPCELMLFMKADYYNKDYIDTYMAPLDTPTFIGTPKAPTAAAGTNTTQIATTAFVEQAKNTRVPVYGMGENLLRNWYFLNPVNQRGATTLNVGSTYFIDGWVTRNTSGSVAISSSGLSITTPSGLGARFALFQYIQLGSYVSKPLTLSVFDSTKVYSATVSSLSITGTSTCVIQVSMDDGGRAELFVSTSDCYISLSSGIGNTNVFKAVKLELGTQQTLAHQEGSTWVLNEIPDYEEELIKCQTSTADSSDTYANKTLATEQQLAYVENGTTASRAYAVGECFCKDGLLYRVTAAISSGGAITPGTNCTQTTAATKPGMRLLWQNQNTANAFAETTCAGTGGFGTYVIVCRVSTTAISYVTFVVSSFIIGETQVITNVSSPASSLPVISFRSVTKLDTGQLTISNCESRTVTSTSRTQTNTDLIPARIYGVY